MKGLFGLVQTASLLFAPREPAVTPHFLFCLMKSNPSYLPEQICARFSDRSYLRDGSLHRECDSFMSKKWSPMNANECGIFLEGDVDEMEMVSHWSVFTDFMMEYKKEYLNMEQVNDRFMIFQDNIAFMESHKQENHSYELGINSFADWTHDEFKEYVQKGSVGGLMKNNCPKGSDISGNLPISIDWRSKGIVATPMNQGSVGTCYTFSTTASMEGALAQKTGTFTKLSEQAIVDCAGITYGDMGVNGGSMEGSFNFVHDNGIPTEASYPYMAQQGSCQKYTIATKNNGCFEVPTNELQITYAVSQRVISIAIQADSRSFQMYKSGVYDDATCYSGQLDHGVALVGYGHDSSSNKDFYILKNSWDITWGEGGYMRIGRNSVATSTTGICGLAMMASYPVV